MQSPTAVESLLRRPGLTVLAGIAGTIVLSWAYVVTASLDMYGGVDGLAAWMMQSTWDGRYFALMFVMWTVMMTAMMVPSAAPTILLYGTVVRARPSSERPAVRSYAFLGGYLLAWTGFSAGATVLQWALAQTALLSPMMESASPLLGALILITAGVYQWTPLKRSCLSQCRSPMEHLSRYWRPGVAGAIQMGVNHGLHCVGCCWTLMLLLFFGGVMNLLWIAGITLFVLLEKVAPFHTRLGSVAGLLLVAAGILLLFA